MAAAGSGSISQAKYIKKRAAHMTHIPYKAARRRSSISSAGSCGRRRGTRRRFRSREGGKEILASPKARSIALQNVATLAESGIGVDLFQWIFMLAPARTPPERIARLNAELAKVLALPDVKEKFEAAGFEVAPNTPQQLEVMIREALDRWGKLVPELGLKVE